MSGVLQILVSPSARRCLAAAGLLAALAACGQKGPLFLTKGDAATGRATLPETLSPDNRTGSGTAVVPSSAASGLPPTGVASPVHTQ